MPRDFHNSHQFSKLTKSDILALNYLGFIYNRMGKREYLVQRTSVQSLQFWGVGNLE